MEPLDEVDLDAPEFGDLYDELPLWSAPFGYLILDRVPLRPGSTILDLGAGTGFLSIELAQRGGRTVNVIAVDPWKAAVERLRRKAAYFHVTNVTVIEQDAAKLSLPHESVDVIVSNLGVNNFENARAVLDKCWQVAKPNATFLLTTNLVGHMSLFYDVYRATLVELGRVDRLAALDANEKHRATVPSLVKQLRGSGFEKTAVLTDSFRMRYADGSAFLRHHFIRLGFTPAWRAIVNPATVRETFEVLERNLNAEATKRGELAFTIPIALVEARKLGPGEG